LFFDCGVTTEIQPVHLVEIGSKRPIVSWPSLSAYGAFAKSPHFGVDFVGDQSGSPFMTSDDWYQGMFDRDDALEAKFRLGVFAGHLAEYAVSLSTDLALLELSSAAGCLQSYLEDAKTLAQAMEVLDRRSRPILPGPPTRST